MDLTKEQRKKLKDTVADILTAQGMDYEEELLKFHQSILMGNLNMISKSLKKNQNLKQIGGN